VNSGIVREVKIYFQRNTSLSRVFQFKKSPRTNRFAIIDHMQINELQKWVADDWEKYPKNKPDLAQQILLVMEELGEVAEAIRKTDGRKDRVEKQVSIGSEMADLLISIITLANTYEIDLTTEIETFKSRLAERQNKGF